MDTKDIEYQIKYFSRLAQYIDAGVSLKRTLECLADTFQDEEKEKIIKQKEEIEKGNTLSRILKEQNFDEASVKLVQAGEIGGVLDETSIKAAEYLKIKRKNSMLEEASVYDLFALLMESGAPILQILEVVPNYTSNAELSNALKDARVALRKGEILQDIVRKYPKIFNEPIGSYLAIGEEIGTLDVNLRKIADYLKAEAERVII